MLEISVDKLKAIIAATTFASGGEASEMQYGYLLADQFPNAEKFWRYFIVPFTNRIQPGLTDLNQLIHVRANTAAELHDIGSFHYSIFYNFLLAQQALTTKHSSFFESFYTHLGSLCDSVEELLIKIYLLSLECTDTHSETLEKLTKEDFLTLASEWYDLNYHNVYQHYLSVGKPPPLRLPMRSSVLEEYFGKSAPWKNYKRLSQRIREYRNVIVHNYQIAFIHYGNGISYIPKKERIHDYKKWNQVFAGAADPKTFERDFIRRELQMMRDLEEVTKSLNELWKKPIFDMEKLLYTDRNEKLLAKYYLKFV